LDKPAALVYPALMTDQNTRLHTADTCTTMADVRYEIDRLDRVLVALIAERQSYMDAAARIKGNRNLVRDEARIEDVMTKVTTAAAEVGLSMAIAEPVWRTMMDRCIAYEFAAFDRTRGEQAMSSAR
jgi:isochorismate pyruvate lyase